MNLKVFLSLMAVLFVAKLTAQTKYFSSSLPLVYISTQQEILDEPKIIAQMGITWNESGEENESFSDYNHFTGNIAIEIRGSSSQMFPKKSYGFELRDNDGADMDFPLLGMPEEEDWILYAPYSDKSLIRNVLLFTLAEKLGAYAPRCRLVELFLNDSYQGVYVLMEKIKRDKNRLDIAKLKADDNDGEELTGGYIVKVDKLTGSGGDGWSSNYKNASNRITYYQYEEPEAEDISSQQANYIQDYIDAFETAVYNEDFDPLEGYQSYANINSFIDYIIMNELSKNVDGYRLSTFLYKDKNEKLNAGPLWDFNLAFGNADYYYGWETTGLQVYADLGEDEWQNPFWWKGLLRDQYFTKALKCRWEELSTAQLSNNSIEQVVDSLVNVLDEPAERNFLRWPVLGEYVWPNYYVAQTYNSEISWLKHWIVERMRVLNYMLPGDCDGEIEVPYQFAISTYPSPFTTQLNVLVTSDDNISLQIDFFTINGSRVFSQKAVVSKGENNIEINTASLPRGVYIYRIIKGNVEVKTEKIVKM
nr:CotH kinase family protein [uncultured Draconibacterium sp.]